MENPQQAIDDLESQMKESIENDAKANEEVQEIEEETQEVVEEEQEEIQEEASELEEEDEDVEEETEGNLDEDPGKRSLNKSTRKKIADGVKKKYKEKIEAEKDRNQKLEDELKQIRLEMAEQKGFQEEFVRSQQKPEVEADPEPDSDLDPEDHQAWKIRGLEKRNKALESRQEETSLIVQEQRDRESIKGLEQQHEEARPSDQYYSAKKFLVEREKKSLKLRHPQATDSQINQEMARLELQIFKSLASEGRKGTDYVYEMARQAGFEPTPLGKKASKKGPNLKKIRENQEKNATLIGGTDAVDEHEVTAEQVLKMSMADFAKHGDSVFKKASKNLENRRR